MEEYRPVVVRGNDIEQRVKQYARDNGLKTSRAYNELLDQVLDDEGYPDN